MGAKSPLQNILWLGGERVGRAALTATVLGIVARHLGPANFGRLSFALSTVAVASAFATFGLEGLVVNELIRHSEREGAVLGTAFRIRVVAGIAAALLVAVLAAAIPSFRSDASLVATVALTLLIQPVDVVDLCFQRHLESRRTVVVRLGSVMFGAVLKIALVTLNLGVAAFAWAQVCEAAVYAIALACSYRRSPHAAGGWTWDAGIAASFWRRGAPLAVAGVIVALSLRFDQLLVLGVLGAGSAGVYFAASRLTEIALFAGTATTLSLFPALAATHTDSGGAFQGRLQATFDALSALGWLVAIGFTALGSTVVGMLYGAQYAAAAPILAIQGWACVFALSAGARWQFILLAAPTSVNIYAALLSIAVQAAVALSLMPLWGAIGAAVAWLAAAVVSGFVTTLLFPSLRACALAQARGLLVPFAPSRWRSMITAFSP
jgi:PST family polysaccharide transporter